MSFRIGFEFVALPSNFIPHKTCSYHLMPYLSLCVYMCVCVIQKECEKVSV